MVAVLCQKHQKGFAVPMRKVETSLDVNGIKATLDYKEDCTDYDYEKIFTENIVVMAIVRKTSTTETKSRIFVSLDRNWIEYLSGTNSI